METLVNYSVHELAAVCKHYGLVPKSMRKDHFIAAIISGGLSEDQVKNVVASAPATPSAVSARVDDVVNTAIAAAEQRILASIPAAPAINPADIQREVNAAVAAAFKPIQSALRKSPTEVQERAADAAPREKVMVSFGSVGTFEASLWGAAQNPDPDYVFRPHQLQLALLALEHGDNVWLSGERGTGKTQFAANLAAYLGRPFFRVSFDSTMERSEFVGADGLKDGNTEWQDGQVLQAYRTAGAICLLDEASMVRPEFAATLHAMLEPNSKYTITSTGETVHRAAGMCFIAADNTNGSGDSTGRYAGTRPQNAALIDRFAYSMKIKFLPRDQEIALLIKRGATQEHAEKIVNVFSKCRAQVGSTLVEPPSLRAAFAFCKAAPIIGAADAWEYAVVNKSPEESQEALRQIFSAHY